MTLFTIPLRCMRAKAMRTILLFGVFALGVASMTALRDISAVIGESFEQKLTSFGANIIILPKKEGLSVSYGGFSLGDVALEGKFIALDEAQKAIDGIELRANIAVIAPKLLGLERIDGGNVVAVGVSWADELALKGFWEVKGAYPEAKNQVLLGAKVAEKLKLKPGSPLHFAGQDVLVSGVLGLNGNDDDNAIFADIALVQAHNGKLNKADFLEVAALCAGCPIEDIVQQLEIALPGQEVRALQQIVRQRMYSVHLAQNMAMWVSIVILITACAMVVMSMLSAVSERRKEIGIMRSVGFSRTHIFVIFSFEALLEGLLAGIIGFVLGYFLAGQILAQLNFEEVKGLVFHFDSFIYTVLGVGVLAVLSAAFPAYKASLVEPSEALAAL